MCSAPHPHPQQYNLVNHPGTEHQTLGEPHICGAQSALEGGERTVAECSVTQGEKALSINTLVRENFRHILCWGLQVGL